MFKLWFLENTRYGEWYSWRASQLSDDVDSGKGATRRRDCKAKVKDDLTGEEFLFFFFFGGVFVHFSATKTGMVSSDVTVRLSHPKV